MGQVWGQDKGREKRMMFGFRNTHTHTQILSPSPSVSESPQSWGSAYEFVRRPQAICWLLILKWSPCGFYACIANSSMLRAGPGTTDTALPPPHCSSPPWIACSHHYCLSHLLSCMQTKNKNKKSRSFFVLLFSPLLCLVCLLHVSLSAEPSPAKTDSNLEADERTTAGWEQGLDPSGGQTLEVHRVLGHPGALAIALPLHLTSLLYYSRQVYSSCWSQKPNTHPFHQSLHVQVSGAGLRPHKGHKKPIQG